MDDSLKKNIKKHDVLIVILDSELLGSGEKFEQIMYAKSIKKKMILFNEENMSKDIINTWFDGCNVLAIVTSKSEADVVLTKYKIKSIFIT